LNLGKGESEVIALGRETGIRIIIDDLKARKVAATLELSVTVGSSVLNAPNDSNDSNEHNE